MRPVIAFNLISVPDQDAYKECSAHFAHLPDSYLKKFTEVAALEPDPANGQLQSDGVGVFSAVGRSHRRVVRPGNCREGFPDEGKIARGRF